MKKLTSFLICLLAVIVGAMFAFNFYGVTQPGIYYSQFENQKKVSELPVIEPDHLDDVIVPEYYNCIDTGKVNKTRDQGELGSCWAFAANAALESRLLPEESWDFSEDHMLYHNGFFNDGNDGGDCFMAIAYLTAWKGPVPEEQDPYNDGETNSDATAVKHLQEVLLLEDEPFEVIKKMIYCYGAVESSIYIAIDDEQYIDETYYNRYNYTYCYNGDQDANHEIVIIGWDDEFPKEYFNTGALTDGAFICLNSWGSEFGANGVFYVSYDDAQIAGSVEVYSGLEPGDNYDNIYQNDELGWIGRMGFDSPTAFFANVYTAKGNETLEAVSFYATDKDTTYAVYVCNEFQEESDLLLNRSLCAQGVLEYSGYYTIDLSETCNVKAGEKYAVIVEITTPGSIHPIAVEMNGNDGRSENTVLEGRESYVSANGRIWERTQDESKCNVCLKAFTNNDR